MSECDVLFLDPVVRGPLFACAFMSALCGIIGVFIVFRHQSLIGETVSHSCYPGLVIGAIVSDIVGASSSMTSIITFIWAGLSAWMAAYCIQMLLKRQHISSDAALSFVLAVAFSIGILLISTIQSAYPSLWRRLQFLLLGQASTMGDGYILFAFLFFTLVMAIFFCSRRSLKVCLFDADFAQLGELTSKVIDRVSLGLVVAIIIVSVRSMGVILMSALLIFPAISARLLASKFEKVVLLAGCIGCGCGMGGVIVSHTCAAPFHAPSGHSLWLPTGPLIVLFLTGCFFIVLLFSPSEGLLTKVLRRYIFAQRCRHENALKILWKECCASENWILRTEQLRDSFQLSHRKAKKLAKTLQRGGYINILSEGRLQMTSHGIFLGKRLVRVHRLWELYLVELCEMPKDRVHPHAEEMEHILTPEIERELSLLLQDPLFDPHAQPIPKAEREYEH